MFTIHLLAILFIYGIAAKKSFQFNDDDYIQYRTLPNHRAMKWNITYYDRSAVAPGYWFTAPYWEYAGEKRTSQWIPYQIGPHIFDQDGDLVWAGSAESDNRPSFDFRVMDLALPGRPRDSLETTRHLAWMLWHDPDEPNSDGAVMIYDNAYRHIRTMTIPSQELDTHDFHVIEGGTQALMIRLSHEEMSLTDLGQPEVSARMQDNGFVAIDLLTGRRTVDWVSRGRIGLDESFMTSATNVDPDFLHANAIDKSPYGDYLLSGRHTSTIYLISGRDGHVIWRLGGKKNDFVKDFDFFGQHDARFISVNETHYVISFLNNGTITSYNSSGVSDNKVHQPVSTAMYVELDVVAMTASTLHTYPRPDGGSTGRRGNMQTLPNQNVLVSWSSDSYLSEFSADGHLLMEAKFGSVRFDTYRSYKFPWVGRPLSSPTVVSESHGVNGSELSTSMYMSWNGATDIAHWRLFGQKNSTSSRTEIGMIRKEGFETFFIARGFMDWVSVEALGPSREVLGVSSTTRTPPPKYWAGKVLPQPDDPETFLRDSVVKTFKRSSPVNGIFVVGALSSAVVWLLASYRHALTRHGLHYSWNVIRTGYLPVSRGA